MIDFHRLHDNIIIAELTDDELVIDTVQDALDLMADLGSNDCNRLIIYDKNLHYDFFDLKTGFAGEILQKFSNYHVRLAIVGDFTKFKSNSLRDFIYESNKTGSVIFTDNLASALEKLS